MQFFKSLQSLFALLIMRSLKQANLLIYTVPSRLIFNFSFSFPMSLISKTNALELPHIYFFWLLRRFISCALFSLFSEIKLANKTTCGVFLTCENFLDFRTADKNTFEVNLLFFLLTSFAYFCLRKNPYRAANYGAKKRAQINNKS